MNNTYKDTNNYTGPLVQPFYIISAIVSDHFHWKSLNISSYKKTSIRAIHEQFI